MEVLVIYVAFIIVLLTFTNRQQHNRNLRSQIANLRNQLNAQITEVQKSAAGRLASQPECIDRANSLLDQAVNCMNPGGAGLAQEKANLDRGLTIVAQARAVVDGCTPR